MVSAAPSAVASDRRQSSVKLPSKTLCIPDFRGGDRRPSQSAGVILATAGDARAAEFLDLGEKALLLPEEKALVEKARRSLAQR